METVSLIKLPGQDLECFARPAADQSAFAYVLSALSRALLRRVIDSRPTICAVPVELSTQVGASPGASRVFVLGVVIVIQVGVCYWLFKLVED